MTEQEFFDIIVKLKISLYNKGEEKFVYGQKRNPPSIDSYIKEEWRSGGIAGGSCWTDNPEYYAIEGNDEPEFREFETIVLFFAPEISLVKFRELSKIIKRGSRDQNEWYGNHTTFSFKTVDLKDLFLKLTELGLI